MNFSDLLNLRYSCRKFLQQEVEKEKIIKCIEAARLSPSACNSQPWRFIVINDSEIKKKVVDSATVGIYKLSKFINNAPVIIVVLADKKGFLSKVGSFIRNTKFYLIYIGIACQNLVLQATELGLGSCYIGWFSEKGIKKVLKIPNIYEIPLIICLGYPENRYKEIDPIRKNARSNFRKDLSEILSFNIFNF